MRSVSDLDPIQLPFGVVEVSVLVHTLSGHLLQTVLQSTEERKPAYIAATR